VASHPTATNARAYLDAWIEFYQEFYHFPEDIPVDIDYGFDTYKVTYCTVDVAPPGSRRPPPTIATGNVSVPRRAGRLSTVAYLHGTSVSFYDAPSNPNIFGEFNQNGESFDGPPSSAIFAGGGFIYVAPDYLGLGDSTVPRHRYFHAATEASSAADLLKASRHVLGSLRVRRSGELFTFGFSQGGHAGLALQRLPATGRGGGHGRGASSVHPLRVRLRQNAVDRWRPDAPIRVYHSPDDEEVSFGDLLVSVDRLRKRGAEVTVAPLPGLDHVNSWVQAMPRAVRWFRTRD
jgi:hypothetical protein